MIDNMFNDNFNLQVGKPLGMFRKSIIEKMVHDLLFSNGLI